MTTFAYVLGIVTGWVTLYVFGRVMVIRHGLKAEADRLVDEARAKKGSKL